VSPSHLLRRYGVALITHISLFTVSIAATHGLVHAQVSSVAQEPAKPSAVTASVGVGDRQNGPSDHLAPGPCSLRVPDTITQSQATPAEATTPTGSSIYTHLSPRCKLDLFVKQTYSPYTFASAAFGAIEAQATGQWPHYGGGLQGWGKRFGATLANTESRRFIQGFALSTMLHQDPRYFPSPERRLVSRAWYAATRIVITKNDHGDSTFNTSEFLGTLLSSALQNSYYPRHDRTFGDTMNRFSGALSSDVIGDLLREFAPNMKRLFRKHAPKKILKIEQKLPIPAEDKP